MDVSIIIVNYNTKRLLDNCLESIINNTVEITYEIIVSDNGSTDGSIDMIKERYPSVKLIQNNANIGFGAANNRALDIATGKYILYLNSDTLFLNNAVKYFYEFWETASDEREIGALGCVLVDENNCVIHSGAPFPSYKFLCIRQMKTMASHLIKTFIKIFFLEKFFEKYRNKSKPIKVIVGETKGDIVGADLFLRNDENARFDERYFMYCEETDLELNLDHQSLRRYIIDTPKIMHLIHKNNQKMRVCSFGELCCQNSSVLYAKKNLGKSCVILKFLIFLDRLNPFLWKTLKTVKSKYR